mmetsp:Transcript_6204/g.19013  ORF Transcript_6204/g.19013 Transcript_6204/m.19013 type:complete len:133 (+) Transcript_6204:351-749(+)
MRRGSGHALRAVRSIRIVQGYMAICASVQPLTGGAVSGASAERTRHTTRQMGPRGPELYAQHAPLASERANKARRHRMMPGSTCATSASDPSRPWRRSEVIVVSAMAVFGVAAGANAAQIRPKARGRAQEGR